MGLRRIYCKLLQLYPADYRAFFAAEMVATFDEALIDQRRGRLMGLIRFILAEVVGLVIGALREWIARLGYSMSHTNGYIDGRGLPDPLLMRPPGIAWEIHYGRETRDVAGARRIPPGSPDRVGECLNAHQAFALASPFRRLAILIFGCARCCGSCRRPQ